MTVEVYYIGGKRMERRCIDCGGAIHECMGFCNGEDWLRALKGEHHWIRERCGMCESKRGLGTYDGTS